MGAEHSARKNAFTSDGGPHKVARILAVADGLRRIGEFESAEMLTAYAERIKADESAVPVGHFIQTSPGDWDQAAKEFIGDPEVVPLFTHPPAQAAQVDASAALAHFTDYFVRNYPGPNTIIYDPKWHAPKIFRAAQYAIAMATTPPPTAEPVAQGEAVVFKHPAAVRSAAGFLLEKFEHAPCDSSGVSCCVRCSAVAMSRWAIEALDASAAAQPRAVPAAIVELSEFRSRGWSDSAHAYRAGWNDCRTEMLAAAPSPGESA